jgi:hypothetical protein
MWNWLPDRFRPTPRGVVENTIANIIVALGGGILAVIGAWTLASIAAPQSDADWVRWFLYALLCLGVLWVLYAVGWRIRHHGWPQFSRKQSDPGQEPNRSMITDSLCKLTLLREQHERYKIHLAKTSELTESIETAFRNPMLKRDNLELWEPLQRLLEAWGNALRATGHAYQQSFGKNVDLSLSTQWSIGQTPILGQDQMDVHTAATARRYYDQKDHLYRMLPEMNRAFVTAIEEAKTRIELHGQALLHKERG